MRNVTYHRSLAEAMPEPLRVVVHITTWCRCAEVRSSGYDAETSIWTRELLASARSVTSTQRGSGSSRAEEPSRLPHLCYRPSIIPALRDHLDSYVESARDALVVTEPEGRPLHPRSLRQAWTNARAKVGMPELHLHDLRHTGNTLAASTGASTKELMTRMVIRPRGPH